MAEPILAAIETNLSLKVVVISPGIETQSATNPHLKKIAGLLDQSDARLAMLTASFEEVVPIIPDIAAQTDLERHSERVRGQGALDHDPSNRGFWSGAMWARSYAWNPQS